MRLINWFRGRLTNRGKAISRYQRGITKAKKHDQQGAIDDYTDAIDMPYAPSDVIAMAMLNRALVQVAIGEFKKGVDDLSAVLAMDGAPTNVKEMAKQKLARRESRTRNQNK